MPFAHIYTQRFKTHSSLFPTLISACFFFVCCLSPVMGYAAISGSCNGVWGVHLPNSDGGGNGGYKLVMGPISVDSKGNHTASVSITHVSFTSNSTQEVQAAKGTGYYRGFLLKAFDPYTGLLVGTFNGPLPANTMHYDGCSRRQSAISHDMPDDSDDVVTTDNQFTFRFIHFSLIALINTGHTPLLTLLPQPLLVGTARNRPAGLHCREHQQVVRAPP
jgi:hypothetical protein